MVDLPTVSVPAGQRDRILAAFGGEAGYQEWVRAQVVDHVIATEQRRMQADALQAQRDTLTALRAELTQEA